MAYNSVARCRIFVDYLTLWHYYGLLEKYSSTTSVADNHPEWIGLNPTSIVNFTSTTGSEFRNWLSFELFNTTKLPDTVNMDNSKMFSAILGHNLAESGTGFVSKELSIDDATGAGEGFNVEGIVNVDDEDGDNSENVKQNVPFNGYSIRMFDPAYLDINGVHFMLQGISTENPISIGSCAYGVAYTLPHSPDLSLSISYETGTKTIETRGGSSLSNTIATPPKWGDLAAWELRDPSQPITDQLFARNSRRIWDLSFSFLDKTDTFPKYNALNRLADTSLSSDVINDTNEETILDSDDFFSMVYNKVGTAHKFIFQPDTDVNEFAICKFDMNSFKFDQVANGVYNIKLKIREVW